MVKPAPAQEIFTGGQMTDLLPYPGQPFDGTELFEIVAPGNAFDGVNYGITSAQLSALLNGYAYQNTILTAGATVGSPYTVPTTVTRLLLNKAAPSASSIILGPSAGYAAPVLIRDLLGDASTHNITVTFSNSQQCDGLTSVKIVSDFGGWVFNPLASGGWYLTSA